MKIETALLIVRFLTYQDIVVLKWRGSVNTTCNRQLLVFVGI